MLCIYTLSKLSLSLALKIKEKIDIPCNIYLPERHRAIYRIQEGMHSFSCNLVSIVRQTFNAYDKIIFIMATGIVVRVISGLIKDKNTDPGVVVIDDHGRYVISLLSGHLGGANNLAKYIASIIEAEPVITTASDVRNIPPLDDIFSKRGWVVEDEKGLSHIMSSIIDGEEVYIYDSTNLLKRYFINQKNVLFLDKLPTSQDNRRLSTNLLIITSRLLEVSLPAGNYKIVWPKELVIGIGCRRGVDITEIDSAVKQILEREKISIHSIRNLATINLKRDELAINKYASAMNITVEYFTRDEILRFGNVPNPSLKTRRFVGVDSVCEATAMMSAGTKTLLIQKQKIKDLTLAIAKVNYS